MVARTYQGKSFFSRLQEGFIKGVGASLFGLFDAEAALNPGGGMIEAAANRWKKFLEKHPEL
ncbi:MAG: hypothetical protein MRQ09_02100 [Candidatus Midichloria sp.]|nr:hypothetical protein [Candidatus Midichloria sp.]